MPTHKSRPRVKKKTGRPPKKIYQVNIRMQDWMTAASETEQENLALLAKTSRRYLKKLASGEKHASAALAGDIAEAVHVLRMYNDRLPRVLRTDLCAACAACPYALGCPQQPD